MILKSRRLKQYYWKRVANTQRRRERKHHARVQRVVMGHHRSRGGHCLFY